MNATVQCAQVEKLKDTHAKTKNSWIFEIFSSSMCVSTSLARSTSHKQRERDSQIESDSMLDFLASFFAVRFFIYFV